MLTATLVGTVLSYTSSGFEATRVFNPAVAKVGADYSMLYAGLPFANNVEVGLATASDPGTWVRNPSNPVIKNSQAPSWASFRECPVTLFYAGGTYGLWFYGDNRNLSSDPGFVQGFGYASSPDGINWTIDPTPIRLTSGAENGVFLRSVAELGGKYAAYFTYSSSYGANEPLYVATSSDGKNFSVDIAVNVPSGYELLATTTTTIGGQDSIFSIWESGSETYCGVSTDGINFTMVTPISIPTGFLTRSILVDGDHLELFGVENVGNINWEFGNQVISYAVAPLGHVFVPEPNVPMALLLVLSSDIVIRRRRRDNGLFSASVLNTPKQVKI